MSKMRNFNIVDSFVHHGLRCEVVQAEIKRMNYSNKNFHNGYVRVDKLFSKPFPSYKDVQGKVDVAELTFSGRRDSAFGEDDGYWMGFDTNHSWNERNPKSKKLSRVRKRTRLLAEEFLKCCTDQNGGFGGE